MSFRKPVLPFLVTTIALVLTAPSESLADRPEIRGNKAYFGTLHAHSALSDDVKDHDRPEMSPADAYKYAHDNGLDFLGISDHHKATDSPGMSLRLSDSDYEDGLFGVAAQYSADNEGEFVAIAGIEWGNTATGNHINIFGQATLPPDTIDDDDYDEMFVWAGSNAAFVQLNHPYSWDAKSNRNRRVGNFADSLYADPGQQWEALGQAARLISVICTVPGGHLSGEHRHSEQKRHRETSRKAFTASQPKDSVRAHPWNRARHVLARHLHAAVHPQPDVWQTPPVRSVDQATAGGPGCPGGHGGLLGVGDRDLAVGHGHPDRRDGRSAIGGGISVADSCRRAHARFRGENRWS